MQPDEAQKLRKFAIEALDDGEGIESQAYSILDELLKETGNEDICGLVHESNGRAYLYENDAQELRDGNQTESENKIEDPPCQDCPNKVTQPFLNANGMPQGSELVGCTKLTTKEWENHQTNCPLKKS
jgi:hypothetical protein